MTKEEQEILDYQIEVMEAYKNGAEIEFCENTFSEPHWEVCNCPKWDWMHYGYHVKETPKYRPYKDAQEFLQAQKEHGMYLYTKKSDRYRIPTSVGRGGVELTSFGNAVSYGWELLLDSLTWQDGTPCGIKE